ncbi:hypothetical protein RAS1_40170 [Phycisphaerae bacterium RAS1]|nr:hypothetical protein RAS1_40170 [Phycisphaerae bacterium RAS1]
MRFTRLVPIAVVAGLLGCASPAPRLNAPPHGSASEDSSMRGTFVYMADNAMLADMTVSDVHFVPHRPMLNTLGQERVQRLAGLIDAYGGAIRFSSDVSDAGLLSDRTQAILACLTEAGVDARPELVQADLAGDAGMNAAEVLLIRKDLGVYTPKKKQNGGGAAVDLSGLMGGGTQR